MGQVVTARRASNATATAVAMDGRRSAASGPVPSRCHPHPLLHPAGEASSNGMARFVSGLGPDVRRPIGGQAPTSRSSPLTAVPQPSDIRKSASDIEMELRSDGPGGPNRLDQAVTPTTDTNRPGRRRTHTDPWEYSVPGQRQSWTPWLSFASRGSLAGTPHSWSPFGRCSRLPGSISGRSSHAAEP
jgi:hypothetical protein